MMSVEEFEETYGNLQTQYNEWRRKIDQYNKEERNHDSGHTVPYFTECVFGEARENFSQYCDLPEIIPVDVMFSYENNYTDEQEEYYEIYLCPENPTENGKYYGKTPILEQAQSVGENGKRNGLSLFIKKICSDGNRIYL